MLKMNQLVAGAGIVASLAMTATPVFAEVVSEQSQELNQSVRANVTINGYVAPGTTSPAVSAEASGSQSGSQRQSVRITRPANRRYVVASRRYVPGSYVPAGYIAAPYISYLADGQAYLGWGFRGGTCHVRYTESGESYYKYATAASCDDGGVTIGGLTPGVKYRFIVSQDNRAWSRPVTIKAQ